MLHQSAGFKHILADLLIMKRSGVLYCIHESILRSVEHQSVPLALDVVVFRLLSDIESIKLQFSGQFLLSLEDNQRDLKGAEGS